MKGSATQSRKTQLLQALRKYFATLSQARRNELGGSLGITPTFSIVFVDGEDGRPRTQSLEEFQHGHDQMQSVQSSKAR
jgi:hypothetical protein